MYRRAVLAPILLVTAMFLGVSTAQTVDIPDDEYLVEGEIFVPMRDGVRLSTDIVRPKSATGQLPTVLVRTPYLKVGDEWNVLKYFLETYVKSGYAVVLQNERGRFFSEGHFENYLQGSG